jgi:hypothetical protein
MLRSISEIVEVPLRWSNCLLTQWKDRNRQFDS